MSDVTTFNPDHLKPADRICTPDPRHVNSGLSIQDEAARLRGSVEGYRLNGSVPENIVIHFETAKNLYLYALFASRFYSVAEQQAFASLEFALREKFKMELKSGRVKRVPHGVGNLLEAAIESGFIPEEKFTWLDDFIHGIPRIKNDYADGRNAEDQAVVHLLDPVSQLINLLFQ